MVPQKDFEKSQIEQIDSNSASQKLNSNPSSQIVKSQNRAKKNWSKVRQLLIKNLKNKANSQKQQNATHSFDSKFSQQEYALKNCKNNVYNLFDKLTKIIQTQQQSLIQTKYQIEVQTCNNQLHQNHQKINKLILTTLTPLPSVQKILKATQNQQCNQSTKIDTTGFWIWQAEQIMTYFLIKKYQHYRKRQQLNQEKIVQNINIDFNKIKSILELGAGSSGLAAMVLPKLINMQRTDFQNQKAYFNLEVEITDGKIENIQYLKKNIQNNFRFVNKQDNLIDKLVTGKEDKNNSGQQSFNGAKNIHINAQFMLWGTQIDKKYDLILAADCLFFESYHNQLIKTLKYTMYQNSIALFVNPTRGKSMQKFIQFASQEFYVDFVQFDDKKFKVQQEKVRNKEQFDPDRFLFKFLKLKKIPQINSKK